MPEATDPQTVAAEAAGLHPDLASRLRGETFEELTVDAANLADALRLTPSAPGIEAGPGIGGGTMRELPRPHAEQLRDLARRNPREFNRKLDAGEISLADVRGLPR